MKDARLPWLPMNMLKNKDRGFTLVEILMVITAITILASIIFITGASTRDKARKVAALGNFDQITKAINLYYDGWPQGESYDGITWSKTEVPPFADGNDPNQTYPNWDASYYCNECKYELDIWDDDGDGTFACSCINITSATGLTFIYKNIICDDCPDYCGDYSFEPQSPIMMLMLSE